MNKKSVCIAIAQSRKKMARKEGQQKYKCHAWGPQFLGGNRLVSSQPSIDVYGRFNLFLESIVSNLQLMTDFFLFL